MSRNINCVSVIIPAFNASKSILRTLNSVFNQTYTNYEIVVVDDGSTDDTRSVIQPYLSKIRYIYQQNQERSAARNTGIEAAEGEYIAFLDADDTWMPNKLEKQIVAFENNPELGMVYCQAYLVAENGQLLGLTGICPSDSEEAYQRLLLGNFIPSPTPLLRRSVVKEIGGFDSELRHAEDWDYWLRAARVRPVGMVQQPLANYCIGNCALLLQRMDARNAQDALVRVIQKAESDCSEAVEFLQLALALAWFQGFLVDVGVGKYESGHFRLKKALGFGLSYKDLFIDLALQQLIDLAATLSLDSNRPGVGQNLIRSIWCELPSDWQSAHALQDLLSEFYTYRFFQAAQISFRNRMLLSLIQIAALRPRALMNRGIWSMVKRSFLIKEF